ncbi:hypothetical protein KQ304_06950 [Synechococcus sp. CS-1329]|uniref:hypothetical protein n=1 Tax=Synechococcus sp. CS-1329 TaxID=2847975 RepID=UPI00223B0DBE|nr:hypothetical protein [Synechococcus sp. CS-1329]MCT0218735.1 hypothetical protein [Synechococcus sp. CS-1329]
MAHQHQNKGTHGMVLRRWLLFSGLIPLAGLSSCGSELPPCLNSKANAEAATPAAPAKADAKALMIGIDGSGSMLGHAEAGDASGWRNLLQAINLSAETIGLSSQGFRVGGQKIQPLTGGKVTQATDPCFFKGCGSYPPVSSSLQTLWTASSGSDAIPLRLLVSDLEVNQSDISSLVGGIRTDLAKGASAGVLALKLPFNGKVFDPQGNNFYTGKLNRPLYLLATGKPEQVKDLLALIQSTMAQKGVAAQELSMLEPKRSGSPLTIKSIAAVPLAKGKPDQPIRIGNSQYSAGRNGDYRSIQLLPGATGVVVDTIKPWGEGSSRGDLGLVRLERIPLLPTDTSEAGGIRLRSMSMANSNIRLELDIPATAPAGLLRATIPQGNMPDQWWFDWDRSDPRNANAKQQTEGLLLLMTTLGQQIAARDPNTPPAAVLCIAFQHN